MPTSAETACRILAETGQSWLIGVYIAVLCLVSLIAVSLVPKSQQGRDLQAERD